MDEKISVSIGRTINLGNFESERFDISYERKLKSEEDMKKAIIYEYSRLEGLANKLETQIRRNHE